MVYQPGVPILNRTSSFLGEDEYVKVIDFEGNEAFFRVGRREWFSTGAQFVNIGTFLAPAGTTDWLEAQFLQPARENRLFQFRLVMLAKEELWEIDQAGTDGFQIQPNVVQRTYVTHDIMPPQVLVFWELPSGTRRGGTDLQYTVTWNTIANQVIGGVQGGAIPANMIAPDIDPPNELFDMFTIFGAYPRFLVSNGCRYIQLGRTVQDPSAYVATQPTHPKTLGTDWYLYFYGFRYMMLEALAWEVEKLLARELPYRAVTVGGVPQVSTKA